MTPSQQRSKDLQDEARREQQADERIHELEQEVKRLREAIADACFALDHSDIDGAKGYLLYALGEQDSCPVLEENERLREAAKDVVTQIFLSSDGRTLDHSERKHLLDAGEKLESALDGEGEESAGNIGEGEEAERLRTSLRHIKERLDYLSLRMQPADWKTHDIETSFLQAKADVDFALNGGSNGDE